MKNNIILNLIINFLILYQINGLPLSKDVPYNRNKPDEQDNLFEGDIVLPPSTLRGVLRRGDTVAWPNGIVPYEIAPGYESEQEQFIISTMRRMENSIAVNNVLCVHFRPKTSSDQYYITIRNRSGCSSPVGQNPGMIGERTVSLQHPGCIDDGRITHELLHTLGFYHEQSRPDRDSYVKILSENIKPSKTSNFDKYDNSFVNTQNTPYDYESVMHYERNAFSLSPETGLPTIEPIEPGVEIGQRIWMSSIDIEEVRFFYNCSSGIISPTIPTTTASNYSSAITTNDGIYMRPGSAILNYYEAIQIMVNKSGIYYITSLSDMDTIGFLYDGTFNPSNSSCNLFKKDDDTGGNNQFKLGAYLEAGVPYILVVSTFQSRIGPFSVVAKGPGNVQYIPMDPTVTSTTSTTTRPSIIYSNYSSALTLNSETFSRKGVNGSVYYYNAIEVQVKTVGNYTFKSSSSFDTYGYLYRRNFDPSYPSINRMSSNDDSAGSRQFQLTGILQSDIKYILVFTTYGERITGPFDIIASGPDDVSLKPISN